MRPGHTSGRAIRRAILLAVFLTGTSVPSPAQSAAPDRNAAFLAGTLDEILRRAVDAGEIPGAVAMVTHRGRVVYRKAHGHRALLPAPEPMSEDTIFDLASLTKPIATATAVMKLVERGRLRLNDPVARYIPEFAARGKDQVTVRHLLTHHSGLRAIPRLGEGWAGSEAVLAAIYDDELVAPPGMRFLYSDTGFILLGELVRRVSGLPLDEFFQREIAVPLGLKYTRFRPPAEWRGRIAPTEEIDLPAGAEPGSGRGRLLRGEVHDPRARGMGGVAGHAGLFSTADEVSAFCGMLLEGGGVLAPATVEAMRAVQSPPWSPAQRGLGWDLDSVYSAPRGELFASGSFGHTGFTGTSLWADPSSGICVVLLANSVHPMVRPAISSLRSRVATAVAAALTPASAGTLAVAPLAERAAGALRPAPRNARTLTGLDVLAAEGFAALRGRRVGLITNHTGVSRGGQSAVDLLAAAEGVELVALFSPEHGIAGREDATVASATDPRTGLPIHSLYGETRRPTAEMLRGVDALVFDIQDAGVRFYTYITTMAYAMEEAARHNIPFYVLDRPNPLGGVALEGPVLDADRLSFVGYFPMPVRHGMTVGELARMFNAENRIGAELHVIPMRDWRRTDTFEMTGLEWVAPSPNLRSLDAALLYPGIEILQAAGVSVGRGTDTPFELFGAPWMRGAELADDLNRRFIPGVRFVPVRFTPREGLHRGAECQGVAVVITDRVSLHTMLMGLEISAALWKLYPRDFQGDRILTLLGSAATVERLKRGDAPARIVEDGEEELRAFRALREKYLLYK